MLQCGAACSGSCIILTMLPAEVLLATDQNPRPRITLDILSKMGPVEQFLRVEERKAAEECRNGATTQVVVSQSSSEK
jgi:hypothetical protein